MPTTGSQIRYSIAARSQRMDLNIDEMSAVVLASSSGLGRAIATRFVAEGANVIITSRSQTNLETAVESIRADTGCEPDQIDSLVIDLFEPDSIEAGIETAIDRLGGLDMLVTNHGGPETKPFAEASLAEFDDAYMGILRSTIHACKASLPTLQDGGGTITNLVSASTLEPTTTGALSNVIRPGIFGLSKTLANEYGSDGVRVNCVCPRGVLTDRIEYKIEVLAESEELSINEAKERRIQELPISRLGSPEEFAKAVTFIASPAAGFITGAVLSVDGGWSRHAF